MKIVLFFLLLFSVQVSFAQKPAGNEFAAVDQKALQLPEAQTKTTADIAHYIGTSFSGDPEKIRAIFIWVASNIQYDVENQYALNFYEKREDKIQKSLLTRKGICENYAALFTDLCTKSGIESYVVEGYTKQNGAIDNLPHAWCAAKVSNTWALYDPTWGSGYVNGGKFTKKINNKYYQIAPEGSIKSHMPFDYLWQFLNYPVTALEFSEGKTQLTKSKPFFSYPDTLAVYNTQEETQKLLSAVVRIEQNGVKNALIFDRLQHLKVALETDRNNKMAALYNSAVAAYNEGIRNLNAFIAYRNKQFLPAKPDAEIQEMLALAGRNFRVADSGLHQISTADTGNAQTVAQLLKAIQEAVAQGQEQAAWLQTYLGKNRLGRKSMFYKVSWFGIPVN